MSEEWLFGKIRVKVDPDMPPDQIRLHDPNTNRCVAKIINIDAPKPIEPPHA